MLCVARDFVGMPYQAINRALGLILSNDKVHMSERAHGHIMQRHLADYELCMDLLDGGIAQPDFAGQTPLHPDNFFLIRQHKAKNLLVAVSKIPNDFGKYPLQSCYLIDNDSLHRRLRKTTVRALK